MSLVSSVTAGGGFFVDVNFCLLLVHHVKLFLTCNNSFSSIYVMSFIVYFEIGSRVYYLAL